ncbi:MAG TPA: rRNA maturation RNase YbeY, partial [Thermoanaerobaculia bacterium]|nr:rRNA maturation RNase YbeY [Thermoanaerobaculia bacterium]
MEIDVRSSVSGAPSARRTQSLLRAAERLFPPPASRLSPSGPELSVLFCGDTRMRALNRHYRRKDRTTDVLAFPGGGGALGDIVISLPYASREARRRGEGRAQELDRLLLHGYLHLLGYDHEVDDGQMDRLESKLRRRLGLSGSRVSAARSVRG